MNSPTIIDRPADSGFESTAVQVREAGAAAAISREQSEVQAAMVVAMRRPRDELACHTKIVKAFQRPGVAEVAEYSFPRGGTTVNGPSVDTARELARIWMYLRHGIRLISMDDEYVHVAGFCWDLETNNCITQEQKFKKLIFRKKDGWIQPDERDLRELINKHGAICERNGILQVLPPDIVDAAMEQARDTKVKIANKSLKEDRTETIRRLVYAFNELQVNADMLVAYLGHALDLISADELTKLKSVYQSMKAGNSKREEHFVVPSQAEELTSGLRARRDASSGGRDGEEGRNVQKPDAGREKEGQKGQG